MSETTDTAGRAAAAGRHDAAVERIDLSRLPSVERVMAAAETVPLIDTYGRTWVLEVVRSVLSDWRRDTGAGVGAGGQTIAELSPAHVASTVKVRLEQASVSRLRAVFNLTGTVLHTNLGRAPLPDAAVKGVVEALTEAVSLEFDLATGRRGDRDDILPWPRSMRLCGCTVPPSICRNG